MTPLILAYGQSVTDVRITSQIESPSTYTCLKLPSMSRSLFYSTPEFADLDKV